MAAASPSDLGAIRRLLDAAGLQIHGESALLRSVVVDPAYRGHGVGASLVAQAEAFGASQGVRQLALLTETAAPFFESLGYARTARDAAPSSLKDTSEFRALCHASAACLTKTLSLPVAEGASCA